MKQEYFSAYQPRVKEVAEEKQLGLAESFKIIYTTVNEYFGLDEVKRIDRWLWWAFYLGVSLIALMVTTLTW
jgi:hypothetical protein